MKSTSRFSLYHSRKILASRIEAREAHERECVTCETGKPCSILRAIRAGIKIARLRLADAEERREKGE